MLKKAVLDERDKIRAMESVADERERELRRLKADVDKLNMLAVSSKARIEKLKKELDDDSCETGVFHSRGFRPPFFSLGILTFFFSRSLRQAKVTGRLCLGRPTLLFCAESAASAHTTAESYEEGGNFYPPLLVFPPSPSSGKTTVFPFLLLGP